MIESESVPLTVTPKRKILLSTLKLKNWKTLVCFVAAFCFLSFGLTNQYVLHLTTIFGAYKVLEYLAQVLIADLTDN